MAGHRNAYDVLIAPCSSRRRERINIEKGRTVL